MTSVSAISERKEHVGINASFENASGNNNTLGVSNVNDETRHNIPDEVSELSVPETHFDGQAHAHHILAFASTITVHAILLQNQKSHADCENFSELRKWYRIT